MRVVIPFKNSLHGLELRYALRSITKFVDDPSVVIVGDLPKWVRNINYIHFKDNLDLRYKEKNIYEKLMLIDQDFAFFNDDHYLLEPFTFEYHYSGNLLDLKIQYEKERSQFSRIIENTINVYGNIKNYFRHQPIFIKHDILKKINVDWRKEWGFCTKSIYCHLAGVEGVEYPDLKIRKPMGEASIWKLIEGRQYFSTYEPAMNRDMIIVLEKLYPDKSKYEL